MTQDAQKSTVKCLTNLLFYKQVVMVLGQFGRDGLPVLKPVEVEEVSKYWV